MRCDDKMITPLKILDKLWRAYNFPCNSNQKWSFHYNTNFGYMYDITDTSLMQNIVYFLNTQDRETPQRKLLPGQAKAILADH